MGVVANEPSMEDILSSIKRIIADGSDRTPPAKAARKKSAPGSEGDAAPDDEDFSDSDPAILELTEEISLDESEQVPAEPQPAATLSSPVEPMPIAEPAPQTAAASPAPEPKAQPASESVAQSSIGIISDSSAQAARESLSHLSALLVRPREGESNTLEGLVREMLRPMLKEWLEANLPDLVESMVKKEIDRIVGRLG